MAGIRDRMSKNFRTAASSKINTDLSSGTRSAVGQPRPPDVFQTPRMRILLLDALRIRIRAPPQRRLHCCIDGALGMPISLPSMMSSPMFVFAGTAHRPHGQMHVRCLHGCWHPEHAWVHSVRVFSPTASCAPDGRPTDRNPLSPARPASEDRGIQAPACTLAPRSAHASSTPPSGAG